MISDSRIEGVRGCCARGHVEILAAASFAFVFAFWPGAVTAASFLVDTALDSHDQILGDGLCSDPGGMCSLRAGVEEANALGGPDTISLGVVGPYNLTLGQLTITSEITIFANSEVIRWAGGDGRLIQVQSGSLTLEDATLREGAEIGLGGGLHNDALTNLVRCTIIDNTNVLQGGGVSNSGPGATLNIIDSAVLNNSSGSDGGGIYNESGTVNIANSIVYGNRADDDGAGIYSAFGTVNATSLTVSRNTADHDNDGTGSGGGFYQYGSTFKLKGTIVAENFDTPGNAGPSASHPDLAGQTYASQGHNLIGNVGGFDFSSNSTGDHYGDPNGTTAPHASAVEESEPIHPFLGGLTGAPPLLRLLEQSPAIDWLPVAECTLLSSGTNPLFNPGDPLAVDQEGDQRPVGLACDQGSDEAEEDPPLFSDGFEIGNTSVWSASVP